MSQPFDLRQFPDLPPEVVKAFAAQQAALAAAQFEASVERAYTLSLHDALPSSEERRVGKECTSSIGA